MLQRSSDMGNGLPALPPIAFTHVALLTDALVAQLDRALDYESRGREFESSRARHFLTHESSIITLITACVDWLIVCRF